MPRAAPKKRKTSAATSNATTKKVKGPATPSSTRTRKSSRGRSRSGDESEPKSDEEEQQMHQGGAEEEGANMDDETRRMMEDIQTAMQEVSEEKKEKLDEEGEDDVDDESKESANKAKGAKGNGKEEADDDDEDEEAEQSGSDSDSSLDAYLDRPQSASDQYFIQSQKVQKTSDNTLSNLNILPQNEQNAVIRSLPLKHQQEKENLLNHYQEGFRKWFLHLKSGFNLLCFGYGSKKALIQEFAKTWLTDGPVVVVNGYFPGMVAKQVLTTITNDILQVGDKFRDTNTHLNFISQVLQSESCFVKDIYIIIHNIDGRQLRKPQTQELFGLLASIPSVHLIASIDHLMAPLMWDFHMLANFQWLWRDVTTYLPYTVEASYDVPIVGGETETRSRGIQYVLQSLTPNHRDILIVLAQKQLGDSSSVGLSFQEYLSLCQDSMLAASDTAFRTHLTEMLDHELVQTKRIQGKERYIIPYSNDVIREHIIQH